MSNESIYIYIYIDIYIDIDLDIYTVYLPIEGSFLYNLSM